MQEFLAALLGVTLAFLLSFATYTSIKQYVLELKPISFSDSGHGLFSRFPCELNQD